MTRWLIYCTALGWRCPKKIKASSAWQWQTSPTFSCRSGRWCSLWWNLVNGPKLNSIPDSPMSLPCHLTHGYVLWIGSLEPLFPLWCGEMPSYKPIHLVWYFMRWLLILVYPDVSIFIKPKGGIYLFFFISCHWTSWLIIISYSF